jgi:hypothetical protein
MTTKKFKENAHEVGEFARQALLAAFVCGAVAYVASQPLNPYKEDSKSILEYIGIALTSGPAA